MSCPCPSGYTPTIDSDSCILTITAATSGGSFFYTGVAADNSTVYGELGVIFYEDITNLTFPITISATTGNTTTEDGTPLNDTSFVIDSSGRILNMVVGGPGTGINNDGSYGPTSLTNSLWGDGLGSSGRLNNGGIWASTGGSAPPFDEWIGFSYCLDISSGGTYYIGISGDDYNRFKVNGVIIFDSSITSGLTSTSAYGVYGLGIINYTIFPYTFTSGLNIIEVENINVGGPAAFVAEIYSGNVSTLSGYTSYSQLSADTIFSTFNFIGQDIPLSSSGATTNTGYTCPDGYSLYTCSGSPYCVLIDKTEIVNYCIQNTGLGYDDNYIYAGMNDAFPYWSGDTSGLIIYYSTAKGTWCLSDTLFGDCLLEGPNPCSSSCPDLCDTYVFSGACPTPTPTPTVNCSVLDFTAIFDCAVTPTPSVTPTISVTPTLTPTPSSSNPCGGRSLDATITGYTPTPTATPTVTPTATPQITRPCGITGNVTFITLDNEIICPVTRKFVDCANGQLYYTDSYLPTPSGDTLTPLLLFKANVDGESKCIVYIGVDLTHSSLNTIELVDGPLGDLNIIADCSPCTPDSSPTPTPTSTLSPTPTPTSTPSSSPLPGYYTYKLCGSKTYLIQSVQGPTTSVGTVFRTDSTITGKCWSFVSYTTTYPTLPPSSSSSFITYNYFPTSGILYYSDCNNCINLIGGQTSPVFT